MSPINTVIDLLDLYFRPFKASIDFDSHDFTVSLAHASLDEPISAKFHVGTSLDEIVTVLSNEYEEIGLSTPPKKIIGGLDFSQIFVNERLIT